MWFVKGKKSSPERSSNFDREFFANLESKAHTKGGIVGYHRKKQAVPAGAELLGGGVGGVSGSSSMGMTKKEWKKHQHGKRREKLRIINKHLDQHEDF